eukprot:768109-Hanusia_phi.AAC.6
MAKKSSLRSPPCRCRVTAAAPGGQTCARMTHFQLLANLKSGADAGSAQYAGSTGARLLSGAVIPTHCHPAVTECRPAEDLYISKSSHRAEPGPAAPTLSGPTCRTVPAGRLTVSQRPLSPIKHAMMGNRDAAMQRMAGRCGAVVALAKGGNLTCMEPTALPAASPCVCGRDSL